MYVKGFRSQEVFVKTPYEVPIARETARKFNQHRQPRATPRMMMLKSKESTNLQHQIVKVNILHCALRTAADCLCRQHTVPRAVLRCHTHKPFSCVCWLKAQGSRAAKAQEPGKGLRMITDSVRVVLEIIAHHLRSFPGAFHGALGGAGFVIPVQHPSQSRCSELLR